MLVSTCETKKGKDKNTKKRQPSPYKDTLKTK